jgi:hypothetical protein
MPNRRQFLAGLCGGLGVAALPRVALASAPGSTGHLDRFGNVESMEGSCRTLDLTGVDIVLDSDRGFTIVEQDGRTAMESWDNCHYDYDNQMSVCDEFVLPEPCECSEPYEWEGQA